MPTEKKKKSLCYCCHHAKLWPLLPQDISRPPRNAGICGYFGLKIQSKMQKTCPKRFFFPVEQKKFSGKWPQTVVGHILKTTGEGTSTGSSHLWTKSSWQVKATNFGHRLLFSTSQALVALPVKLMGSTLFPLSLSPVCKRKKEKTQQLHKLSGESGTCRERQPSVSLPLCRVIHMALACTLRSSREGNRGSAEAAQLSLPAVPRRSPALQGGGTK